MLGKLRSTALVVTVLAAGCSGSSSNSGFDDDPAKNPTNGTGESSSSSGDNASGGFGGGATNALIVEPSNGTAFIDTATNPAAPGTLPYVIKLRQDGVEKDVTSEATLEIEDGSLGSFKGNVFTTAGSLPAGVLGKSSIVRVKAQSYTGVANLTVVALRRSGANRDFYFFEPYGQPPAPANDVLKFSTNIKQVDVAFVMDTTGSMSGSINNLKTALSGSLISQLQAAIPSVAMAVVDHKDYPVGTYGSPGDFPVRVHQVMTSTATLVQAGVAKYSATGGNDGPESQIPAMQHTLTGEALLWSGGSVAAHTPAAGTWGGVDFRPGAVPVIVLITDIDWHGAGHDPYSFTTPTMATLKAAFAARNARFVDITSGDESQANELSDATGSAVPPGSFGTVGGCSATQCCTGVNGVGRAPTGPGGTCRLNFLHSNGTGVSNAVAKGIEAIAVGSTFDVTARPSNDPKNAGGVDATKFIKALRAKDEGDAAAGCPANAAKDTNGDGIKDTFTAVKVGTPVCFEIVPAQNDFVPPSLAPQFYKAFIDVLGVPGNVQLDRRDVTFLVPPKDANAK
ncbi:MAG: VWA domain-containing protein [Myxococcales bacterium]|nr:VWA domain-containing protein [Myxococcales bacterium]